MPDTICAPTKIVPGTKSAPILFVLYLFHENSRVGAVFVPGTISMGTQIVSGTLLMGAVYVLNITI